MTHDNEFTPMHEKGPTPTSGKRRQKSGVIKSSQNHVGGTIQLTPPQEEMEEGVEFFQPIYEGDTVVGVFHKCSCGKTAEIRFQYTDQ